MKTIEQLLKLSKNQYYVFTKQEREVLDAFLSKNQDTDSKTSQKKSSGASSSKPRVTVKNVVKKADTYPPQAAESEQDERKTEERSNYPA